MIYRWKKPGGAQPWRASPKMGEGLPLRRAIAGILLKLPASGGEKCIKTVLTQSIFVCAADIDHRKPS
ncbi:hypothetical protein CO666_21615 [Rhizobium chutanense]|uniref:Uncharacterized protein n=1 Tax=Rhizobium chutanense TaxID=2035448 RepID=A0A2A6J7F6_9HYPH|nr:hypothetical protein CO666_21615 [Rhizobium chutanense]